MNNQNNNFIDFVDVLAFIISIANLYENRIQTAQNDVNAANDAQAEYLLSEINRRFDEQNLILAEQNRKIEDLLKRLDGDVI